MTSTSRGSTGGAVELTGHRGRITSAVISVVHGLVLTGSHDGSVRAFRLTSGKQKRVLGGHDRGVDCLALLPGEEHLAVGTGDGHIALWSFGKLERVAQFGRHFGGVTDLCALPEGRLLSASRDGMLRVYRLDTHELVAGYGEIIDTDSPTEWIESLEEARPSPDGRWVVAVRAGFHDLRVWEVGTDRASALDQRFLKRLRHLGFVRGAPRVLALTEADGLALCDLASGAVVETHRGVGPGVASPDGRWYAAPGEGGVVVFDLSTAEPSARYETPALASIDAVVPHGGGLAVMGAPREGAHPVVVALEAGWTASLEGQPLPLDLVAGAADGSAVVTGCFRERLVRLWRLAELAEAAGA